jgi:hypothetical protein
MVHTTCQYVPLPAPTRPYLVSRQVEVAARGHSQQFLGPKRKSKLHVSARARVVSQLVLRVHLM